MFTTKDFLEYYKTISNAELLSILNNKKDYQEDAMEAAKQELLRRQLSEEEVNHAKKIIEEQHTKKEKKKEKLILFEESVKTKGKSILENLRPFQTTRPTTEKTINAIGIIFGFVAAYQIFTNPWYFLDLGYFYNHPSEGFFVLYPLVVLPVAVLAFLMRKKIGWILLASYLTYSAIWVLRIFTSSYVWRSGSDRISHFFQPPSPVNLLIELIIYAGILYALSKPPIRDLFFISKTNVASTIAISWVITFIVIFFNS